VPAARAWRVVRDGGSAGAVNGPTDEGDGVIRHLGPALPPAMLPARPLPLRAGAAAAAIPDPCRAASGLVGT